MNKQKAILFITTSNLTTNPRLIKEALTAFENGYSVEILCFAYRGWSEEFDKEWIKKYPEIHVSKISTLSNENRLWMLGGLMERILRFGYPMLKKCIRINAYASTRRSLLLKKRLFTYFEKETHNPFDLLVAHNLGALYPAWIYYRKTNTPFAFDVEDYYPGEFMEHDALHEKQRRDFLLKKLIVQATYVTVASPLIGEHLKNLVGEKTIKNLAIINNCFPSNEFELIEPRTWNQEPINSDTIISLPHHHINLSPNFVHFVWFSQNIAANRGLELIIPELTKLKDKVHLHLVGNLYEDFKEKWIEPHREFITTYIPMSQKELNLFICQFDVGLALEPGKDENNLIAISNKIYTYLQAGLYILATNTPAQKDFINQHKDHGAIFEIENKQKHKTSDNSLKTSLINLIEFHEQIRKTKTVRFFNAKRVSWEMEQNRLIHQWNEIIS